MSAPIRIIPLGGLGEIGMNMMVLQQGRDALVIDCGVTFADNHLPGIDLVLPDFSPLRDTSIKIHGIVLTHGHEDHIGALPFFLRERSGPVFGSRFTLALVRERLREHDLLSSAKLHLVADGERRKMGPFDVEFLRMNHSIADAMGLAIRTSQGLIVHTGDFKIDPHPVDGRKTDLKRFAELGKEGVLLLFSDSTNVEVPGTGVSERTVEKGLRHVTANAPGWLILALFASHIPRITQVFGLARDLKRRVLLAGRSMIQNVGIARELGYLKFPDNLLIEPEQARSLPRHKLLILSTGTQGEPRSALARMAFDEHKDLKIAPGDRVVLSSRMIPGNEKAIYSIINHLYRRGAEVFTTAGATIHVSGHAYRGDLEQVLKAVRPKYFVPVHGEYRHLVKHAALAEETGVPRKRALLLEDGDVAEFSAGHGGIIDRLELSRSIVDGRELADIASGVIRDRIQLSETGLVVVVVILDAHSGEIVRGPELFARGVVAEENSTGLFEEAREAVVQKLRELSAKARTGESIVQEDIRLCVRRFFKNRLDRKPVVIPVVMEV